MSDDAVVTAARVLADCIGLRVEGSARRRLERAIVHRARLRRLGLRDYAVALRREPGELARLIDSVTVQESRFFRDPAHFAVLRRLLEDLPPRGLVWSAGCANGQEPWSVAMFLAESGADGWRVLATDVSEAATDRAALGVYGERELTGLSTRRRALFMERKTAGWRIADGLRDRVTVRRHNLTDTPPAEARSCSIVFCRNVLIYLRPADVERALRGIASCMTDAGFLFLGAGEALAPAHASFTPQRLGNAYVYRPTRAPRPGSRPADAAPSRPPAPQPSRPGRPSRRRAPDTQVNLSLARARLDADARD